MKKMTMKAWQDAIDAGIVLRGMMVIVNGIQVSVEEGSRLTGFSGTDTDGKEIEFTEEQVTAIID
jgi:hypothetical protein|tara:strand:+ start:591 stop:785 length:195 start_codon:yes stop_codon:yes gene_type:complete